MNTPANILPDTTAMILHIYGAGGRKMSPKVRRTLERIADLVANTIKPERIDHFLHTETDYFCSQHTDTPRSPADFIREGRLAAMIHYLQILRGEMP